MNSEEKPAVRVTLLTAAVMIVVFGVAAVSLLWAATGVLKQSGLLGLAILFGIWVTVEVMADRIVTRDKITDPLWIRFLRVIILIALAFGSMLTWVLFTIG